MKHPSYKKASNQYAGRSPKKLTQKQKEDLSAEMKKFRERLKKIEKRRNIQ
tara:strand:+ start:314 stop:466 length:153 start_codon:yes stop_codon:yes gene_type:complete